MQFLMCDKYTRTKMFAQGKRFLKKSGVPIGVVEPVIDVRWICSRLYPVGC